MMIFGEKVTDASQDPNNVKAEPFLQTSFTETVESKAIARYVLKTLSIRAEKEHWDHEVSYKRSFTETVEQTGTLLGPARDHVHTCGNSFNTFIIVIKIKFITIFIVNIIYIIIQCHV